VADLEARYFCEEAPEFDYRKGMFHVVQIVGGRRVVRVMPPETFFETIRRAVEISRRHKRAKLVAIGDHAATGKSSK
jgi:hypothetical protein